MANRKQRERTAAETVEILERGEYVVGGETVTIAEALAESCRNTVLYTPEQLNDLIAAANEGEPTATSFLVSNCTTFDAARQLLAEGFDDPLCLNFASAKNPGGGFLSGSQAQEECLARASGLYATLQTQFGYYEINRECSTSLYTNHAIYSPRVPVFRDNGDALLTKPYRVSFVTSPAVNAGAVRQNEPENVGAIEDTMRHRIDSVLAIARAHGHRALVLGAWGCGVFKNDPADIATWFRNALTRGKFAGVFDRVIFAVLDFAEATPRYNAFQSVFSG